MRGKRRPLADLFNEDPPIIHFENGDFLVFNELFELPRGTNRVSFDRAKITPWKWDGTDIRKELQGPQKVANSIQGHLIRQLRGGAFGTYDLIFDGDGKGEVADVVAIRRTAEKVSVDLFHCKYSKEAEPGARVDDLYPLCGQAQKCVHWRESPRRMLRHLLHQEDLRVKAGAATRFEEGTANELRQLLFGARQVSFEYRVFLVQPGLSKGRISQGILDVLGATETFLQETYSMPLRVIASE